MQEAKFGGDRCIGSKERYRDCYDKPCPGKLTEMTSWPNDNVPADCISIDNRIEFLLQLTVFGIPGVSGANVPQLVVEGSKHQKGIQGKQSVMENDVMVR